MGFLFLILGLIFLGIGVYAALDIPKARFHLFKALPFWSGSFLTFLLFLSFTTVDAGSVGIVKYFGQPARSLNPGAHFILPFADTVTSVAVQTRIVKPSELAASHDLQVVHMEVTLAYHVDPRYAMSVLVELNDDAETRIVTPAILEAMKATTAKFDAQQLIAQRVQVRDEIEEQVKARIAPYHLIAENVSITDFNFSKEYNDAIEAKVTAQQKAEKASNDLKRIQIEAEQQVAQAKGEAEALRAQKEQITPELLQLRTIEMLSKTWDGHMPQTIVGQNGVVPMLDVLKAAGK